MLCFETTFDVYIRKKCIC